MKKKLIKITILLLTLLTFTSCQNKKELDELYNFEFDDLKIIILNDIKFYTLDKEYDIDYGKEIVSLPLVIKNLKEESHHLSMFYYTIKSPNGIKLESKAQYYNNSVDYAENLKQNEEYTKYLYFTYENNGTYTLIFNNGSQKKEITINIKGLSENK